MASVYPHVLSRIDNYRDVFVGDNPTESADELGSARAPREKGYPRRCVIGAIVFGVTVRVHLNLVYRYYRYILSYL